MNVPDLLRASAYTIGLLRSEWWSQRRIRGLQERRLVAMMRYAVTKIPYYRCMGITPDSISQAADLRRFPYLTKSIVQERWKELLLPAPPPDTLCTSPTSRSPGEPTTTYFDRSSWLFCKYAVKVRRTLRTMNPIGKRFLIIAEAPPEASDRSSRGWSVPGRLLQVKRKSIFDDIADHAELIRDYRPDFVYAFPSFMMELLDFFEVRSEQAPRIPVITTSSELLTQTARASLESGFGSRVVDVYGSTEFKEVAWQCDQGTYHLNFESVFVETKPAQGGTDRGSGERLVLSSLRNRAMPLLRYDVGDHGRIRGGPCACGRQSPHLEDLSGREAEMLLLPEGKRVFPYLLTQTIEKLSGVRRYRVVQVDEVTLRLEVVASDNGPSESELSRMCRNLEELLEGRVHVSARAVETIPRTPGGKACVVAREINSVSTVGPGNAIGVENENR